MIGSSYGTCIPPQEAIAQSYAVRIVRRARVGVSAVGHALVRRDRSGENLLKSGHHEMADFLAFRQMLLNVRNNMSMRWPVRRNGVEKPGPLTVAARKILLKELRRIEHIHSVSLLSEPELTYIKVQWRADRLVEKSAGFG